MVQYAILLQFQDVFKRASASERIAIAFIRLVIRHLSLIITQRICAKIPRYSASHSA